MIVKSSQRGNHSQLSGHLASDENEQVTVLETSGVYSQDISGALAEFEALAAGSRATKDLYHVSISPAPGETMSAKDWARAWALHDQVQGTEGLPYVAVGHDKNDRSHQHRAYSRIDPETGTARNLEWTRIKNERIARQLEVELGHEIITGKHNRAVLNQLAKEGLTETAEQLRAAGLATAAPAIPAYTHDEWQLAKRGAPLDQVRGALAEAWRSSDSAQAFEAALAATGFAVAQGDRVPVAVGLDGQEIPLLRAINVARKKEGETPLKKADLSERLPNKLPDIDAVREAQAERETEYLKQQATDQLSEGNTMKNEPKPTTTTQGSLEAAGEAEKALKAKGTSKDKPEWLAFREKMLFEHYGHNIKDTNLIKYWKMERRDDGAVIFSNKAGTVTDSGPSINVEASDKQLEKAAAAALFIAQAKGWDGVKVNGTAQFKDVVYRMAIANNTAIRLDNEEDRELYERIREDLGKPAEEVANSISKAQEQSDKPTMEVKKGLGQEQEEAPAEAHRETQQQNPDRSPSSGGPRMG